MLIRRVRRRSGRAGIRRYAASIAADNGPVVHLLRSSCGRDPSIAQASLGIVEVQITIPLRVSATSR
jgi:hypothetical protein